MFLDSDSLSFRLIIAVRFAFNYLKGFLVGGMFRPIEDSRIVVTMDFADVHDVRGRLMSFELCRVITYRFRV